MTDPRPAAVLLALALLLARMSPAGAAVRTGGVPVRVKQTSHCSALAPADWTFTSNPQASAAEAVSPDRTMYAGWGVVGINRAMQQFYGDLYGPPETSIAFLAGRIAGTWLGDSSGIRYTGPPRPFLGYFTLRPVESARHAGVVFYKIYPGSGGPQTYTESVYVVLASKAQWKPRMRVASGVAVSIRCVTQIEPPAGGPGRPGRGGRAGCGKAGVLRGYQKELGTQYAHSRNGDNYLLDPSTDWNENGPQGPGYYRQVGTDYEKLELGRSDDC